VDITNEDDTLVWIIDRELIERERAWRLVMCVLIAGVFYQKEGRGKRRW
jgi:hypothetical protein